MARDKDRKSPKRHMGEYTCPECGKTQMLVVSKKRQRCPDCAREKNKRAGIERLSREMKASHKIKSAGIKPPVAKKPEISDEEKACLEQTKQCKGCHWWRSSDACVIHCCHFYLRHGVGHRRDPGNGPGDCRSFMPKKRVSRRQMIEEAKLVLAMIEKDIYAQKPRKEDGADG